MLGLGIAKGMAVTIKHFLTLPKVTVQYPEQTRVSAPAFRGAPALVFDAESGQARCVACGICARACPHGVIHVTGVMAPDGKRVVDRYEIEITRCLFCGLCAEACPYDAIEMSHEYELAEYQRFDLVYDRERLRGRTEAAMDMRGADASAEAKPTMAGPDRAIGDAIAVKEVAQVK